MHKLKNFDPDNIIYIIEGDDTSFAPRVMKQLGRIWANRGYTNTEYYYSSAIVSPLQIQKEFYEDKQYQVMVIRLSVPNKNIEAFSGFVNETEMGIIFVGKELLIDTYGYTKEDLEGTVKAIIYPSGKILPSEIMKHSDFPDAISVPLTEEDLDTEINDLT